MARLLFTTATVALTCLCLVAPAAAQDQATVDDPMADRQTQFGVGVSYKYPFSSFDDSYNPGWGVQGLFSYPFIPVLDLIADIGWNHFPHEEDGADFDIWEFVGGARFRLGAFFMSGEVGYYTEIESVSFQPGLGLKFAKWDFTWSVRSVDSGSWHGLRVGYYF